MSGSSGLAPARLSFDAAGVPRAETYDDVYHSAGGGPEQANHVFLHGNGLPQRWRGRRVFTIVETGFGLGLNLLATVSAFLADPERPDRLHYVSVEQHPLTGEDLERAHARWPLFGSLALELRLRWPPLLRGFHRIELASGTVTVTLLFGDAGPMLAELDACADAIFLDGFSPAKNPAMWSSAVFRELARLSAPGTTAATWTVAAMVRAGLRQAGFRVERQAGFGTKREMLTATYEATGVDANRRGGRNRRAIVIGAGLAGAWMTHALTSRGWQVDLIERKARAACEASGNPVGAVRPALNLADSVNARLARAAFLLTSAKLAHDPAISLIAAHTGVLHLACTPAQAERMARILATHEFPHDYVHWVDAKEASRRAGHAVGGPGWWIARGGWARPPALCEHLLARAGDRVTLRFGCSAARIERAGDHWRVLDSQGAEIAAAPVLVLANAAAAQGLGAAGVPMLIPVRGQVTYLPPDASRSLEIVVCGDGYVAPMPGGGQCVGATFEPDSTDLELRVADHVENLARLERMLPGFAGAIAPTALAGRVALRTATADRLPVCGMLPDMGTGAAARPDLYIVTGLGARGLIWAPLCADIVASHLEGEPVPVERSLAAAIAPTAKLGSGPI